MKPVSDEHVIRLEVHRATWGKSTVIVQVDVTLHGFPGDYSFKAYTVIEQVEGREVRRQLAFDYSWLRSKRTTKPQALALRSIQSLCRALDPLAHQVAREHLLALARQHFQIGAR